MDYKRHYDALIDRARNRVVDGYVERHHVVPKCMGGSNDRSNLVRLTPEEHYVAHQLLVKMNPGNGKLIFGAAVMTVGANRCNKKYGWIRRLHASVASGMLSGIKRGPFSAEHKAKLSAAKKDGTLPDEQKAKIAASMRAHASTPEAKALVSRSHTGRKRSEETKSRISAANTGKKLPRDRVEKSAAAQRGRKQPIVICPHCDKSGGRAIMGRYHFENCKVKHG